KSPAALSVSAPREWRARGLRAPGKKRGFCPRKAGRFRPRAFVDTLVLSMSSSRRKADAKEGHSTGSRGLFRAILAGPGHTLADAFANLEQAPQVERVWRHPKRNLLGARITLAPEEGEGYWELTRVREELYVVIANFAYKDPRLELVPGDGMVQFNFKISGDMALAASRSRRLFPTSPKSTTTSTRSLPRHSRSLRGSSTTRSRERWLSSTPRLLH